MSSLVLFHFESQPLLAGYMLDSGTIQWRDPDCRFTPRPWGPVDPARARDQNAPYLAPTWTRNSQQFCKFPPSILEPPGHNHNLRHLYDYS